MEKERQRVSVLFMLFGTLFCVCLITANVLETKQISFGPINVTAGLIVFPVSYIINDVVCEVWGYRRTRMLIWMGFAMNFFFVLMGALADWIPGASWWDGEEAFHSIFGLAPRIAAASFIAFLAGSFMNAYVMSKMKLSSQGAHFSKRAVLSTVLADAVAHDIAGDAEDALRNPGAARHHPCSGVHQAARPRGCLRPRHQLQHL